jgi:uncharacterized protein YifE (UPF0438 family)
MFGAEAREVAGVPGDHLEYLKRRPFVFGCATAVFPPEEVEALATYGNWLEALAAGAIQPATAEEEHFLAVDRDEAEPVNTLERAWVRLKGRREYERERKMAPPPPPPRPDDGIIEWDREKCWW